MCGFKQENDKLKAEKAIIAVGIVPNTENLGLEKTKIKLDRGHVITNGYMETDEAGVWAIGDLASAPWLAHKASHEGIIAAEKIAENAGASLGEMETGDMGIFQITGQNSNEDYSWGGTFNTSSRNKTASITVRVNFSLD